MTSIITAQFGVPLYPIHQMDKYDSKVTDLVAEQLTPATMAISLLVNLQGSVRVMDSGLQSNQPVDV